MKPRDAVALVASVSGGLLAGGLVAVSDIEARREILRLSSIGLVTLLLAVTFLLLRESWRKEARERRAAREAEWRTRPDRAAVRAVKEHRTAVSRTAVLCYRRHAPNWFWRLMPLRWRVIHDLNVETITRALRATDRHRWGVTELERIIDHTEKFQRAIERADAGEQFSCDVQADWARGIVNDCDEALEQFKGGGWIVRGD